MASDKSIGGLVWVCAIVPAKLGSFERLCIRMAQRAGAAGLPMRFVFEGEPAPAVANLLRKAGASWSVIPVLASLGLRATLSVRQLLAGWQPNATHFHYCSPAGLATGWLGRRGGRRALTFHISGEPMPASGLRRLYKRLRYAFTTARLAGLTAVSGASRRKLAQDYLVPEAAIRVIYNGVDLGPDPAPLAASDGPGPRLIVVAALIPEKGVDTVIRALAQVRLRLPAARLTVVGTGPEEAALRQLAGSLGVGEAVDWLGLRDDVPALLETHDIALVPSRWAEAFGLTLAEAKAAGRPIIASRVGGIPEIVTHGTSGLLLPPDLPEAWATAIEQLWLDPALRQRLGAAARDAVRKRFTLEASVEAYWNLYRELDPEHFLPLDPT